VLKIHRAKDALPISKNASSRSLSEARETPSIYLPCHRCSMLTFATSQQVKKHEQLARSLKKMERQLDHVLRSIGGPSGGPSEPLPSRHSSPSNEPSSATFISSSPSPSIPIQASRASPKLHSLPDNALNPLGLLAEASLSNRKFIRSESDPRKPGAAPGERLGIANDGYFKPGTHTKPI
jgi:hypothetical protein